VAKRQRDGNRFPYTWFFEVSGGELLIEDWAGPLVKSGGPSVRKSGESVVESWHLQGCSLYLCQLRTDGLATASKY
jgi:hypothetical protein